MNPTCDKQGRLRQLLSGLALFVCFLATPILPQNDSKAAPKETPGEYDVKAAFLLNFARFVEWPRSSERAGSPFSICILGEDPFGESLNRIVAGESISGRPVMVKRLRKWPDTCEVLFISASYASQAAVLEQMEPGILTVGEAPDFLHDGGMIRFVIDNRRVRFDIDRQSVDRAALKISSRLLGVARMVLK